MVISWVIFQLLHYNIICQGALQSNSRKPFTHLKVFVLDCTLMIHAMLKFLK